MLSLKIEIRIVENENYISTFAKSRGVTFLLNSKRITKAEYTALDLICSIAKTHFNIKDINEISIVAEREYAKKLREAVKEYENKKKFLFWETENQKIELWRGISMIKKNKGSIKISTVMVSNINDFRTLTKIEPDQIEELFREHDKETMINREIKNLKEVIEKKKYLSPWDGGVCKDHAWTRKRKYMARNIIKHRIKKIKEEITLIGEGIGIYNRRLSTDEESLLFQKYKQLCIEMYRTSVYVFGSYKKSGRKLIRPPTYMDDILHAIDILSDIRSEMSSLGKKSPQSVEKSWNNQLHEDLKILLGVIKCSEEEVKKSLLTKSRTLEEKLYGYLEAEKMKSINKDRNYVDKTKWKNKIINMVDKGSFRNVKRRLFRKKKNENREFNISSSRVRSHYTKMFSRFTGEGQASQQTEELEGEGEEEDTSEETVLENNTTPRNAPSNIIEELIKNDNFIKLKNMFGSKEIPGWNSIFEEISVQEIKRKLTKFNRKSSPYPGDGITYRMLNLYFEELSDVLFHLFNLWLMGISNWHNTMNVYSIFVDKGKEDPLSLKNWRIISLSSTILKTFVAIINDKTQEVLIQNNVFKNAQKGFLPIDGTSEIIYQLRSLLELSEINRWNLNMGFLDIADAFPSLKYKFIYYILILLGAPVRVIELFKSLLEDKKMFLKHKNETIKVNMFNAVVQGDPFAPLCLIIYLLILTWIKYDTANIPALECVNSRDINEKVTLKNPLLSFADDSSLIDRGMNTLIINFKKIKKVCDMIFIYFNEKKSVFMEIQYNKKKKIIVKKQDMINELKNINCENSTILESKDDVHKVLGIYLGPCLKSADKKTWDLISNKLVNRLRDLEKADLPPNVAKKIIFHIILSSIQFHLKFVYVNEGKLEKLAE